MNGLISFDHAMQPRGLAAATAEPMGVEEQDLPPGAPPYAGGPLANSPPRPVPTPTPRESLSTLAAGGTNHQEAWMAGQASPTSLPKQAPFSTSEEDLPPGVGGTYYGGPLANPKPTPTPAPRRINPADIAHFSWASAFEKQPAY